MRDPIISSNDDAPHGVLHQLREARRRNQIEANRSWIKERAIETWYVFIEWGIPFMLLGATAGITAAIAFKVFAR